MSYIYENNPHAIEGISAKHLAPVGVGDFISRVAQHNKRNELERKYKDECEKECKEKCQEDFKQISTNNHNSRKAGRKKRRKTKRKTKRKKNKGKKTKRR